MNKNNRKEHLYQAAFRLFLSKQFDSVSISDIEKASGMSRGAVVYYGKDKMGLFHEVIKQYLIDYQNLDNKLGEVGFMTTATPLKCFIDSYVEEVRVTMDKLRRIDPEMKNGSRPYLSLILQVCHYFPDLNEEYIENRNRELLTWIEVLQTSIKKKEIRDDIDVLRTSQNFMDIFYGKSFLDALVSGLNTVELKMQLQSFYKLLKI